MPEPRPDPRHLALDVLAAVLRDKRPLVEAFGAHPALAGLDLRDRALARHIATTVVRRLGQIDALIDHCLERPLNRHAWPVRDVLRAGVCQLLFLGTRPHAAVDTAVRLTGERGHEGLKGLVNAVLRRLGAAGPGLVKAQDAARLNTPDWLWRAWESAYGAATCRRIAEAHLDEAPLDITVKADAPLWAERLQATRLPTGSLRRAAGGTPAGLPGFDEGAWWVQDAAAALPARLLGDVAGRRVIELGAAPGGKTAQLAAAGARVTAVDRSPRRLEMLRANLDRLGLQVDIVCADALDWRPREAADAVLLDAPCTATGTLRRHPDVAYLKRPRDVAALAALQPRLLAAAARMTRPGGILVYCACSLQPEEGPATVAAGLAAGTPAEPMPIAPPEVGGLSELVDAHGCLRTLPCHLAGEGGMDGFFAARLRRL